MESFTLYVLTAFALVFVIEGLVYAFFPSAVQKMMEFAINMPPAQLRMFGAVMAVMGLCFAWLLASFNAP